MTGGLYLKANVSLSNGKYCIKKVLGQGSFGITYLAIAKLTTQGNLGTMDVEAKVAIKEFFMSEVNARKEDGSTVEGSTGSVFTNYRRKFKKEAENLAKLKHPNIVKVIDIFDENNTTYYVMEFLDGQNLDDYIKQQGHLSEKECHQIINAVGDALAYMHAQHMLHLDVKPKNIMRRNDGTCCLIDFGLSKQFTDKGEPESSTSVGLGTPGYAPIEQAGYIQDGTFPATLDVYALGATLFKMLTGERPPEATYIINEGFPLYKLQHMNISANMISTVERSMAPLKKHRFQDIRSFLNALQDGNTEETIIANKVDDRHEAGRVIEPKQVLTTEEDSENPNPPIHPKLKWVWCACAVASILLVIFLITKHYTSGSSIDDTQPETIDSCIVMVTDTTHSNNVSVATTTNHIVFTETGTQTTSIDNRHPHQQSATRTQTTRKDNIEPKKEPKKRIDKDTIIDSSARREPVNESLTQDDIYTVVDNMPTFPGGDAELLKYISSHIKYPPMALKNKIQGRVIVNFIIQKDGNINDVAVLRGIDPDLDEEAVRVVKSMPKWRPGTENGQAVSVKYTLPITFRL
jgi:TonB family protein